MELNQVNSVSTVTVQLEKPKKILHFSDGTLEEFSDEDGDVVKTKKQQETQEIIENELEWGPWIMHKSWKAGSSVLAGCDYAGQALANFLGITQSKYSSEIEEYKKGLAEEKEYEKQEKEIAPWHETKELNPDQVITSDLPKTTNRF